MRICILIDAWEPIWGGGQTHVWEIVKRLSKKGWKFDVYTRPLKEGKERSRSSVETHLNDAVRIIRIGLSTTFTNPIGRLWWMCEVVWRVWREHKIHPYGIIHAHAFLPALPGKILSKLLSKRLVFTVHGSPLMDAYPNSFGAFAERLLLTRIKYDLEISVSSQFLKYTNRNQKIVVIPNGVDTHLFRSKTNHRTGQVFNILWVGRFDEVKGIPVLLHAFARAFMKNKKMKLIFVGYGYEEKAYKRLASELNLTKFVRFMEKRTHKQLPYMYQTVDLFVLPSLAEGQPVTLLEAMASGLPVVATRVGDNTDLVRPGINGWLVKPGNIDELSQALVSASTSKHIQRMGKNARKFVKAHYTWEKSSQATEKAYRAVLKSK